MANTLTNLIPNLYESLDVISRELTGFIGGVTRDSGVERAALNQAVVIPLAPPGTPADNTPGVTPPDTGDQAIGNTSITITKSKHVPVRWNGEDQRSQVNAGTYGKLLTNQFTQAMRSLVNLVEIDLANAAFKNASRAYGTAGTTPFGTAGDLSDLAQLLKILKDNGAPQTDLQFVGGTTAFANLRGKQSVLFKVNEAGTDKLLRDGILGRLEGFDMRESGQVVSATKGTGASYTSSTAGFPVGTTQIPLITGTGTINAGDVVTFAGDANKYVVTSGISAPGTITIGGPGLLQALPASAQAVTVGNNAVQNVGFSKSAMILATRPPATPIGPNGQPMDLADDAIIIQDPVSGLAFEVALYRQFLQMVFHVRLAWGVGGIKPQHVAVLLG